ncbi:MAG TPA: hypothetical protein VFN22_04610 [Gemmatimonadales bacterium]|nr:hypothetical protein [Gemmatimonadales bacterium]
MRTTSMILILATLGGATPVLAQDSANDQSTLPFFMRKGPTVEDALQAYREKPYRPVRTGEQHTAPFLSEGAAMPYGKALGPTTPPKNPYGGSAAVVAIGSQFAVAPPEGGSYRPGDTLTVATLAPSPKGAWGTIITPTGLLVVESVGDRQTLTRVAAVYGPIRGEQVVLPTPPTVDPGRVDPIPADGPVGTLLGPHTVRALVMSSSIMFTDLGADDGMRIGDFVSIRRDPAPRVKAADTIDEEIGSAQVIHVGPTTSTIRLIEVSSGALPDGSRVVRTRTLPH